MKKIIFFISCFFLMINTSYAITLSCPEVASPGEVIKLNVTEEELNGIKVKYNFGNGFVYQSMLLNTPWKSYYNGRDGFSIGNGTNQDKLLMEIKVSVGLDVVVNKDYTLELTEIEGSNFNNEDISLDNVSCKIKVLSDINTLSSLTVDGVILNPKFDKNVVSYSGSTKKEKIVINASATDGESKVSGDIGEKRLNLGVNTFIIKVTSARGNVREYKVYITRNATQVDKKSSDVTLKSLTLSKGKIDFDKNKFLYKVDVDYEIDSIDVKAVPNDSKAKVEIEKPDKLEVGENTINIIVTAEDGTKATYVVVVNRKEKLSNDATIKELNIKNYNIDFKSDKYEYQLDISNEDKLDIDVVLSDDKAKYNIIGNKDLKNNSIIEIVVTAEDGTKLSYKVKIGKEGENNSSSIINYIKIIPLIIFIVLIIGVLIVKLFRTKTEKRINNDNLDK